MKKVLLALLVVTAVAVSAPRSASAQSDPTLVKVPFQFIVGETVLPAGTYRIATDTQNPSLLQVTSISGKSAAAFAVTARRDNLSPMNPQAQVGFTTFGGQHFLTQVSLPGSDSREVIVTRMHAAQTLAKLNLAGPERGEPAK